MLLALAPVRPVEHGATLTPEPSRKVLARLELEIKQPVALRVESLPHFGSPARRGEW
ncbi:hypothetical protein sce2193 [Sorangium cellulosum So ce56]|uniref:Uncharacterized protein n=1 Tax=Sorangium cellulosum (strain So ce56) TaxID=448385 RepID=A9FW80_SORC5|nr:hypothetical protein sce2193 [Sorangium cellulosum So ce56]